MFVSWKPEMPWKCPLPELPSTDADHRARGSIGSALRGALRDEPMKTVRKLIEVALPLDAINKAAAREKSIRHGHPSTLHLWWARRPLAAARAVLFAQLVDDPSSRPELFPTKKAQDRERERLFGILRELVKWENTTNEELIERAREEIRVSWRRACADNADHPRAAELFDPERLPAFHDPFAGGGAIPLEAQRLGLEAHASDLNPVAVLINKAMIEIPPKFAGRPPVNPESRKAALTAKDWKGAAGLAEDVRYYGSWIRDEAERRIGHLYPKARVTDEMTAERPDLACYAGRELTVIAWLWARTVRSPNPAFADVEVPLVSNFLLSTKKGKEAWVEPVIEGKDYRFEVRVGPPPDLETTKRGTKVGGSGSPFRCLLSGVPMPFDYLRSEAKAGRMHARLMAVVADGQPGRVYLAPAAEHEQVALRARPTWRPDTNLPERALGFRVQQYGMTKWADLFTERQLTALTTFVGLVGEAREKAHQDALTTGGTPGRSGADTLSLAEGGRGPRAYADSVAVYMAFLVDQVANHSSVICGWNHPNGQMRSVFSRQAIPMVWDYAESNCLCVSSGGYQNLLDRQVKGLSTLSVGRTDDGDARQADARLGFQGDGVIVSTDPPYYDNIGYADLSDFFYVWLRRSLVSVCPDLFSTLAVPKVEELIASPHRQGDRKTADAFFLDGMRVVLVRLTHRTHAGFPLSIYYAFRQSENDGGPGTTRTGWETFLDAIVQSGLSVGGTWPVRSEKKGRSVGYETNALASSIVLACRKRAADAPTATWREFRDALERELPPALIDLQKAGIAPVDLAQAAIGPGMAVFTRHAGVLYSTGKKMTVGEALAVINEVLDETLSEQEGEFDSDTRWALAWFAQRHFDESDYGEAEILAKAKNIGVEGLVEAGILRASRGRVRLLKPVELPDDWNPATDRRLTVWEMVHHLIRVLDAEGEAAAAQLLRKIGGPGETARALAHRLYAICDRQKRPADALRYNTLVRSWPELKRLAEHDEGRPQPLL